MFYTVEKISNQKPLEPIEGNEGIAEEQKEFDPMKEDAQIQVEILDLGAGNSEHIGKFCVEITLKSGSSALFYEQ